MSSSSSNIQPLDVLGGIAFIVGVLVMGGYFGAPAGITRTQTGAGLMIVGIGAVAGPRVLREMFEEA